MWLVIFASVFLLFVFAIFYLVRRALRFGFSKKLYERNKALGILSAFWPVAVCLPFLGVGYVAFAIAFLHLFLFWVITDLVALLACRAFKKENVKRYVNGFLALGLAAIYLTYGWIMAHTVLRTDYVLNTEKSLAGDTLRVAAIADLHAGVTLDGEAFLKECERINQTEPDLVLVCGDFVDDETSREDMIASCAALGSLKTAYGVYFVYGNHDRGYFQNGAFTSEELYQNLTKNGVRVLSDGVVSLADGITVIGRENASKKGRKTASELMQGIDPSQYVIMLDHQPNDYDAIETAAPDLVISGHTHGGHIFPAGEIGLLMGANDALYGIETRGDTAFLVTSGISGWAIPFKTFTVSEFVVIDIETS